MLETLLIGFGLSMDAFAVSICLGAEQGSSGRTSRMPMVILPAMTFGLFQFLMPLVGFTGTSWVLHGTGLAGRIIAAGGLFFIGGKMIAERNEDSECKTGPLGILALGVATSIDALLVGVGFAGLSLTYGKVLRDCAVIGLTTFLLSLAAYAIGLRFGKRNGRKALVFGGLVLIAIGLKALIYR